jgi:transposase-like protein
MARPPGALGHFKAHVVLAVLRGKVSAAEAASRDGGLATSVATWKEQFIQARAAPDVMGTRRRGPVGARAGAPRRASFLHPQAERLLAPA